MPTFNFWGMGWNHQDMTNKMPQQEIILLFQAFVAFVGDVPSAAERWLDDRFYGSQFLNGCNPDTIKRCIELPSKFPVTQELVGNLLDESDTLQKAMEVGFLHILLGKKMRKMKL